jgi:hypothetical protein
MMILRARPEDADMLSRIALSAKRHWGYPEHWIEAWRDILTVRPEYVTQHETHVAIEDGCTVGFYALRQVGDRLSLEHM